MEASGFKYHFSSRATWKQISSAAPRMWWHKIVWFAHAIPRYSFITWLVVRDRLSTGACPYSFTIWNWLCCSLLGQRINPDWEITLRSLTRQSINRDESLLLRLALQATVSEFGENRTIEDTINPMTSTSPYQDH
ncbi:unnamed protein product [Arabis nemorensis]|uniref:Reverse transcriptase zinc-binding domain-containing protein n=1 Tax=Arabis nemorensis TaxID=586526 RepID=A0A565C4A6_9BRAS|nr:unnamed protein product [Arabis nemorensis]